VSAFAARQVSGLTSLTIGFDREPEDETALALATAGRLRLNPITRNLDLRHALEMLPRVMAHFDEPFSDTSALPTAAVCAEARKEFTVVLSGDAGDEVFGGYKNHVRAWQWRGAEQLPLWSRRAIGSILTSVSSADDSRLLRFGKRLGHPVGRFGLGGKVYPYEAWLNSCLKPELNLDPELIVKKYNQNLPQWSGASSIDLAQRTDLRCYMLEHILVKVDRMSMMHGLEVRSPFLDYRVVELGLKVPSQLRTKNNSNKYLLRRLAARHLPSAVCRAGKRGFSLPLRSWLYSTPNSDIFKKTLIENRHEELEPFVNGGAERLWEIGRRNPALTSAVIKLLCYRWWCDRLLCPTGSSD
jgi:asparagine synthase (glutamine-hydrolysing)